MRIARYIGQRALLVLPTLVLVVTLVFAVGRVLGNPVRRLAGPAATPETLAAIERSLGLDLPLQQQLGKYLSDLVSGDLGVSILTGQTVATDLAQRFPATLELTLLSLMVAVIAGVALGTVAALRANRLEDHAIRLVSLVGLSGPEFFWGSLFVFFFSVKTKVFPVPQGRLPFDMTTPQEGTGLYLLDGLISGDLELFSAAAKALALPILTLTVIMMGPIARMTRTSVMETLQSDYVTAARAYGLSVRTILFRYILKNAFPPVITIIGLVFGYLLGGVVLVEIVFSWPGIGRYVVQAIQAFDYAAVQGFVLVATLSYVVINLLVDVLIALLDPRVGAEK